MTDLELMKLLEENDFEPSAVNVLILKEEINNGNIIINEKDILSKVRGTKNAIMISNLRKNPELAKDEKSIKDLEDKARNIASEKVAKKVFKDQSKVIKEEFSDYELYKILDENNFEPSIENLRVLKENIINGNITLE